MLNAVLIRHTLLGFDSKIIELRDQLSLNGEMGLNSEALVVINNKIALISKLLDENHDPLALRTTNATLCMKISNCHYKYWQQAETVEQFWSRMGQAPAKELYAEAEKIVDFITRSNRELPSSPA
jgi:hypothetical protein